MTAPLRIPNRDARRLLLEAQGLATAPTGPVDLDRLIRGLGFVQLDTIQVVARAHHHILWSRNQNYREPMLNRHLASNRRVFEHFTHDASVIPIDFYPMWRRQFRRLGIALQRRGWRTDGEGEASQEAILRRIEANGPVSTRDFDTRVAGERGMWQRPPHKRVLDYLWYTGALTTSHRENFVKFYDLSERVIPVEHRRASVRDEDQVDWLCQAALQRLAFGTEGDIQRFWDAADNSEVRRWCQIRERQLVAVEIEGEDRVWRKAFASSDIETRLAELRAPTSRLRILNPFDPLIRDRSRLKRLFGFDYRVEMFVPADKRRWGYYVYPILEGERFVGRIEVTANRKAGSMTVENFWPEPAVSWTGARQERLEAELLRLARFIGVREPLWRTSR